VVFKRSQLKLLIAGNAFCAVKSIAASSKRGTIMVVVYLRLLRFPAPEEATR
jgi:hypothetical protein